MSGVRAGGEENMSHQVRMAWRDRILKRVHFGVRQKADTENLTGIYR